MGMNLTKQAQQRTLNLHAKGSKATSKDSTTRVFLQNTWIKLQSLPFRASRRVVDEGEGFTSQAETLDLLNL